MSRATKTTLPEVPDVAAPPDGAPEIPDNPSQAELEVMYAALKKAYKDGRPINWYRQWPTKYLIAALPMWWLIDCGLVKPSGDEVEGDCPSECSQRQLAAHLTALFGTKVGKDQIGEAKKSWLKPAFPNTGGLANRDVAVKLWKENVGGSIETAKTLSERKNNLLRIQEEREQIELDATIKANSNKWGLISSMKSFALGIAALVAGLWDKFVEDKDGVRKIVREAALRCGATEEFIARQDAELAVELPKANDGLKAQVAIEGERGMKRFEQQRRDELKEKNL